MIINNSLFKLSEIPDFHPVAEMYERNEFFKVQKRRCIEGYWVGGKWMPGELYYYINFHTIIYEEGIYRGIGLPWLRDIDWEKAYIYAEACGFSGFELDDECSCHRGLSVEGHMSDEDIIKFCQDGEARIINQLKLNNFYKKDGTRKKYVPAREYLPKIHNGDLGKPLYLNSAKHIIEVASRGYGKSYNSSGLIAHNFLFDGARDYDEYLARKVNTNPLQTETVVGAIDAKYSNKLIDKVRTGLERLPGAKRIMMDGETTIFPSPLSVVYSGSLAVGRELTATNNKSKIQHVTFADNPLAASGGRPNKIFIDEVGFAHNILEIWESIENTQAVADFRRLTIYALGTGGLTSGGAVTYVQEIFYNPEAYNCLVFNDEWENKGKIGYFVPGTKALNQFKEGPNLETNYPKALAYIEKEREAAKATKSVTKIQGTIINKPIKPSEIFLRLEGAHFPTHELKQALSDLESNSLLLQASYKVDLVEHTKNEIKMIPSEKGIITEYPARRHTNLDACIEIYEKPKLDKDGNVFSNRYIQSTDPIDDDDNSDVSRSLQSTFVLDTWTDKIVAEYTARTYLADEYYENVRKLCVLYNSKNLYEAHPYSQEVRLPDGSSKLWKDIEIGDMLFGPNKTVTKVIDIPVHENIPVYKITLRDGREIQASDSHIWKVYKLNSPSKTRLFTTKEILDYGIKNTHKQHNFFIPNGGVVNYNDKDVPIDAYTMGLILAEGSIRGSHCNTNYVQISAGLEDAEYYKTKIPYKLKHIGNSGYSYHLFMPKCKEILEKLNLFGSRSETKFIPKEYLFNSFEKRLELLKGLMDGDGHTGKRGASIYITTSHQLKDDILLLCRSMGINCSFKKITTKEEWLNHYRINIYTDISIFNLPRKINDQYKYSPKSKGSKANAYIEKTAITNIEFSHYEMGKCVTVDNKDGLYLIGDYVLTHNCNKKGLYAYFKNKGALHYMAETPQILKDQDLVKSVGIGNKSLGVNMSSPKLKFFGIQLILKWLTSPLYNNPELKNLNGIRSLGLLKELISFSTDVNADRVSALIILMIYRSELTLQIEQRKTQAVKNTHTDEFWGRAYKKFNRDKVYNRINNLPNY